MESKTSTPEVEEFEFRHRLEQEQSGAQTLNKQPVGNQESMQNNLSSVAQRILPSLLQAVRNQNPVGDVAFGPAYQFTNEFKKGMFNINPDEKLAQGDLGGFATDFAKDYFSDPRNYAMAAVGAKIAQPSLSNAKQLVSAPNLLKMAEAEKANIEANTSRELNSIKSQVDYNVSQLGKQQSASLEQIDKNLADNMFALVQKREAASEIAPKVYAKAAQETKSKFVDYVSKRSADYGQKLDAIIGGKSTDIFVDPQVGLKSIEEALANRNVDFTLDSGQMTGKGVLSPGEQKAINLYNKISKTNQLSVRSMLRDKQLLGRQIKYGANYGYDDDLLDSIRGNFAKLSENLVPEIQSLNAKHSIFMNLKDNVNQELDLFNRHLNLPGQVSEKAVQFISKVSDRNLTNIQRGILTRLRSELPDFDKTLSKPTAVGIYQRRLSNFETLAKVDAKAASGLLEKDIVSKMNMLKSSLDIETARLENASAKQLSEIMPRIELLKMKVNKLNKLNDIKKYAIGAGAATLLGGFGKYVYSKLSD